MIALYQFVVHCTLYIQFSVILELTHNLFMIFVFPNISSSAFILIENSCEARYILLGTDGGRDSESLNCQLKHQEPKQQISLFERISKMFICIASLFNKKILSDLLTNVRYSTTND